MADAKPVVRGERLATAERVVVTRTSLRGDLIEGRHIHPEKVPATPPWGTPLRHGFCGF